MLSLLIIATLGLEESPVGRPKSGFIFIRPATQPVDGLTLKSCFYRFSTAFQGRRKGGYKERRKRGKEEKRKKGKMEKRKGWEEERRKDVKGQKDRPWVDLECGSAQPSLLSFKDFPKEKLYCHWCRLKWKSTSWDACLSWAASWRRTWTSWGW